MEKLYDKLLGEYLSDGIDYSADGLANSDESDLEQLAADSYWHGWHDYENNKEPLPESKPVNTDELEGEIETGSFLFKLTETLQEELPVISWDVLERVSKAIASLIENKHSHNCDNGDKSKDEWISVRDILPFEFIDILFYINRSEDPVCYGFYQEDYFIEFDHPDEMIRHSTDIVTHWQPLPPQPNTDSPDCTLEDRIRNA